MPETPARITVVRHGATEWSRSGRHTGRTDLRLLRDGEDEARAVGERLAGMSPALVMTSPLRRAVDTCSLAGFGDLAEPSDLLLEMDYGSYEGLTTAEIRASRPGWDLFSDGCPGGESMADVGARADELIRRFLSDDALIDRDVLVFSHGHILRVLAARWLGREAVEARHLALGSGGIGLLAWENEWRVLAGWNR